MSDLAAENAELRARLAEAEETLEAIRSGAVDALVTQGPEGEQVFTLQGAETPYRLLMESMNEGAATLTPDGTVLYCNRRFAEMAGLPAPQLVGANFCECFGRGQQPVIRALVDSALTQSVKAERAFAPPDTGAPGPAVPVLLSLSPLALDGQAIAVVATDLRERKAHEERLRQLNQDLEKRVKQRTVELQAGEERYRLLFDQNPDGVFALTTQGRFVVANPACEAISGYSIAELLQKSFQDLCAPDQLARTLEYFERGVRERISQQLEMAILRKDGQRVELWVAGQYSTINGQPVIQCAVKDITQRKQAEKERDRVFKYSLDMLCVAGLDGYFKRVSPSFEKTLGWSEAELLSKPFLDFVHPDDREETLQAIKLHERGTETIQLENRYRCKDGSYKWIAWHAHAVVEEQLVVAVARDVTERRRSEAALRQRTEEALRMSEEEFRSLAEAVPQVVWATRPDGWNIFFNQQWVDYTGMTMEESYGHGWNTPFHPEDKQRAWEAWQRATQHNERYSLECRLRRHDGVYRWWLIRGEPMRGANGEILKWFGTCTDIDDLKRAEVALQQAHDTLEQRVRERTAELRQSEQLYRAIGESIDYGVWVCEPDGRNTYASPSFLKLVGLTQEQCSNFGWGDVLHPDDAARTIAAWQECVRTGGNWDIQHRFRGVDGQYHPVLARGVPIRNEKGEIVCWAGINLDISQLKRAEAALASQREELQLILDSAPALIFYKDRENRYLRVNRAFAESMRLPKEQLEGRSAFDLYPPEQAEAFWRDDQEVLASGQPKTGIIEPMRSSSGERWLHTDKVASRDAQGNLTGIIGFALDITERKRAEEAAAVANRQIQSIIDNTTAIVYAFDLEERFVMANATVAKLLNSTPEQMIGRRRHEFMPKEDADWHEANDRKVFETGRALEFEEYSQLPGRSITWLTTKFPLRDAQGRIYAVAGISTDVTERKRAEEAIAATNAELTRFNDAMVSRELRMIELKQEINKLCAQAGQPPRYPLLAAPEPQIDTNEPS